MKINNCCARSRPCSPADQLFPVASSSTYTDTLHHVIRSQALRACIYFLSLSAALGECFSVVKSFSFLSNIIQTYYSCRSIYANAMDAEYSLLLLIRVARTGIRIMIRVKSWSTFWLRFADSFLMITWWFTLPRSSARNRTEGSTSWRPIPNVDNIKTRLLRQKSLPPCNANPNTKTNITAPQFFRIQIRRRWITAEQLPCAVPWYPTFVRTRWNSGETLVSSLSLLEPGMDPCTLTGLLICQPSTDVLETARMLWPLFHIPDLHRWKHCPWSWL